jgi:hypothetical protein
VAEINLPGSIHLTFFGLVIPVLVVRGRIKLRNSEGPLPNRLRHFQATAFTLVAFAFISLKVAQAEGIELFPRSWPPLRAVLAGLVMLVTAVAVMRPRWGRAVEQRTRISTRILHLVMPANAVERAWWIVVRLRHHGRSYLWETGKELGYTAELNESPATS